MFGMERRDECSQYNTFNAQEAECLAGLAATSCGKCDGVDRKGSQLLKTEKQKLSFKERNVNPSSYLGFWDTLAKSRPWLGQSLLLSEEMGSSVPLGRVYVMLQ